LYGKKYVFTGSLPDFRRIAIKMPENHREKGFLIRLVLFMSCVILAIVLQNVLNSGTG